MKAKKKMGLLVEEGVENLLTENKSSSETSADWNLEDGYLIAQSADWALHGIYSVRVEKNVDAGGQVGQAAIVTPVVAGTHFLGLMHIFVPHGSPYIDQRVDIRFRWIGGSAGAANSTADRYTLREGLNRLCVMRTIDRSDRITVRLDLIEVDPQLAGSFIYIDNVMIALHDYSTSWHLGGSTRAPSLLRLPLTTPLPSDFGIGLSARMLHESVVKNRTFWQAGPYKLRYDSSDEKLKMQFGEVEAAIDADWDADDIIGVYGGRKDGKLFLQSKVAGEISEVVESGEWGENLYEDGSYESGNLHPSRSGTWNIINSPLALFGENVLKCEEVGGQSSRHGRDIDVLPDMRYSASVWVWVSEDFVGDRVRLRVERAASTTVGDNADLLLREQWQKLIVVITSKADAEDAAVYVNPTNQTAGYVLFDDMKFEQSDTPTPWTPAPADYEPIDTITIGSSSEAEGHINGVAADFAYHDRAEKIDPAGYLAKVPGGEE